MLQWYEKQSVNLNSENHSRYHFQFTDAECPFSIHTDKDDRKIYATG